MEMCEVGLELNVVCFMLFFEVYVWVDNFEWVELIYREMVEIGFVFIEVIY